MIARTTLLSVAVAGAALLGGALAASQVDPGPTAAAVAGSPRPAGSPQVDTAVFAVG